MTDTPPLAAGPLLREINAPSDLKLLAPEQLPVLAEEIRDFLVDRVSRTGGHLGPNLGVVELTLALHRVFDSPTDRIVFDTGHQAYVHKIVSGRREHFDTLRREDGLSGYPSRSESDHDVVENSHASTALSYADGLVRGFALRGQPHRRVIAVVGDGALSGGMCWEALNNIGAAPGQPVIVVLNDNGRSYAPTTGALGRHLTALRKAASADAVDGESQDTANLFTALGLAYIGPVDGHDVPAVEAALRRAAALGGPVLVHCVTRKGRGYLPAERHEADCMHAVGVIDRVSGIALQSSGPSWTSVFGEEIVRIAAERADIVAITAAMVHPTGLHDFARAYPDRVFDVGIAEQHAVTSAAGLALAGLHPVVALYSTFVGRAFDQLLMDVALHRLPVTFVLDRAGITGPDGSSHHGMWDLALLAVVPGLAIAVPRDPARLRELLRDATANKSGPTVLRFPKSAAGPDISALDHVDGLDVLGITHDAEVLLVGLGPTARACVDAAAVLGEQGIGVTVVDPRWAAPLNPWLPELASAHRLTVTVEDNIGTGGFGSRLAHQLAQGGNPTRLRTIALPHRFLPHGTRADLLRNCGLDAATIVRTVLRHLDADSTATAASRRRSAPPHAAAQN
ncbi:1-deoxy-D-xylulose-5-phosphate synthase [Umezawaea endophytica]|uniref:1-deoxy-D-xylulose-5-phosphate synthase n=1 Tax=Umezawaea endophytica TaxID=1654476 RepID=A0A9X2VXF9_9PSEU|nr:1-deoxy-D-xylulose-5-phosphate synthase [Umezawaea endophytica]MCS7483834.1 1-deoxy-D-xylulose-5-phosphate synthase [Umezawaea endophytica]